MAEMMDGHLGMMLGVTVAAMLANGTTPEEVRIQFETALKSAQFSRANPEAARPMVEAALAYGRKAGTIIEPA